MLVVSVGGVSSGFDRSAIVRVGRDREVEVTVAAADSASRYVSKVHLQVEWDGFRWRTLNMSDKPQLAWVYEPGFDEVPLVPGATWFPVRHRWAYALGHPASPIHVGCETGDHTLSHPPVPPPDTDDDPTAQLDLAVSPSFTELEVLVIRAYYEPFAEIPRPPLLAPRTHLQAARHLRSVDSGRKAIERINQKIALAGGAPEAATGRNISAEIGRWLVRIGALDPVPQPPDHSVVGPTP